MTPDEIRTLYDYNSWANHKMLDACEPLTPEQFIRDLGSSFGSVRDTLAHIRAAEWLWLERWHGRIPTELPTSADYPTLASLREGWAPVEHNLNSFLTSLTAAGLARPLTSKTTAGKPFTNTFQEMLQHVVNHSTYHRGQVTTLLRQLGAHAPATDLIAFYRERSAAAAF